MNKELLSDLRALREFFNSHAWTQGVMARDVSEAQCSPFSLWRPLPLPGAEWA